MTSVLCHTANPATHCVKEVNGLAFAGAPKACSCSLFFRDLLVLPALPSVKSLCLKTSNSEGKRRVFLGWDSTKNSESGFNI